MMTLFGDMLCPGILSGGCTTTYNLLTSRAFGMLHVLPLSFGSTILMYLSRCTGLYSATRAYGIKLLDSVQLVVNVLNGEVTSLVTTSRQPPLVSPV